MNISPFRHFGLIAALSGAAIGLAADIRAAGRIVVAHDDLVLADAGFHPPSDPGIFARNLASWFTGGRVGRFLVFSDNQGLTGASLTAAMVSAGHTWVVDVSSPLTLSNMFTYDGVFLCGHPVATDDLVAYVSGGGSIYLAAVGVATDDMPKWNPFLERFGLGFTNQGTGVADFPISSGHAIFSEIDHLYGVNGTAVVDLQPGNPINRILIHNGDAGLFAVWGSEKSRLRIRASQVELCWDTDRNVTYRVEYRSALTTNVWLPFDTNCFVGDGSVKCVYDFVPMDQPQKFYRLITNCIAGQ